MNIMQQELKIRGYSPKTINSYEFHNNAFLKLINKSPRDVTTNDIKDYIRHLMNLNYERATINLSISALRFYYSEILKRKFIVKRLKSQKKLFDVLSKQEIIKLFDSAKNLKHKLMLKILYYTGVRVSELVNIKTKDIDLDRNLIHIRNGKGRKDRFISLQENLISDLKIYIKLESNEYLFYTKKGKYSIRTIQKICKIYTKKANILKNVTPHTLRRTFATHLIENKNDIYKVSKLMGHSNTSTTEGYISYAKIPLTADL